MVSVTVFVTMFSFTQLLGDVASVQHVDYAYSLSLHLDGMTDEDLKNFADIEGREDVKELIVSQETYLEFDKENPIPHTKQAEKYIRDTYRNADYTEKEIEEILSNSTMEVVILPEQEFSEYTKSIGAGSFKDLKQAVLVNDARIDIDGKTILYQIFDCKSGDTLEGYYYNYGEEEENEEKLYASITIGAVTDVHPTGYEGMYNQGGLIVVSDAWAKQYPDLDVYGPNVFIDCDDADALQKDLMSMYGYDNINNIDENRRAEQAILWIINIFLYGFICVIILISVTNIFNTVTTSMEVRRQEFAALQSVGMTPKQFRYMVRMESFFYGVKALTLGVVAGSILSYVPL